jgi:nucleotidyltransferase/DNA polymerase involved in DNA repair
MHAMGIETIGDLRERTIPELERDFGSAGEHFYRLARGWDDRSVAPPGEAKSISHEHTFEEDLEDPSEIRVVLLGQTEAVGRRLRRHGFLARTVTVKIRYGDFETITRSATLDEPTDLTDELWRAAAGLFDRWARASFRPVRLIGMGTSHLGHTEGEQLSLFRDEGRERKRELDRAVDRIRDRYGADAIRRRGET